MREDEEGEGEGESEVPRQQVELWEGAQRWVASLGKTFTRTRQATYLSTYLLRRYYILHPRYYLLLLFYLLLIPTITYLRTISI